MVYEVGEGYLGRNAEGEKKCIYLTTISSDHRFYNKLSYWSMMMLPAQAHVSEKKVQSSTSAIIRKM